ncbi:MAG: ThiF family adenylyltransferase, partial [Halobacteriaceae archaeon]
MVDLDATQLERYSRHIIMEGVGPEGQASLLDSSVLVVGAGGLGSPVIQYLAAAGVGTIGVIDADEVDRSNLQRQVIHRDSDIGVKKVDSASRYIDNLNPDIEVETYAEDLGPANADLVKEYDAVVDCSDNFTTRFLVNDACVMSDTTYSHGAVYRFE